MILPEMIRFAIEIGSARVFRATVAITYHFIFFWVFLAFFLLFFIAVYNAQCFHRFLFFTDVIPVVVRRWALAFYLGA